MMISFSEEVDEDDWLNLLTAGVDDDEDDEDDDGSGSCKGDDGSMMTGVDDDDDDDGCGGRGLPPSSVLAGGGVVEAVVELDVRECKEEDDDEADESRLVCECVEKMRVEVDEASAVAAVAVAAAWAAWACDDEDRFVHAIRFFMSDANKQNGIPDSTLLLLSVSSMQEGPHEGAGRWGGRGGLKVSTKDKEEGAASAVEEVEEVVVEERVAEAAVVALAPAPADASLAVLPAPVPVLPSLFFFLPLKISTTLNLQMRRQDME